MRRILSVYQILYLKWAYGESDWSACLGSYHARYRGALVNKGLLEPGGPTRPNLTTRGLDLCRLIWGRR